MQIVGGIVWLLLIGWMTFYSIQFFVKNINPKASFSLLFEGFKQKMWMTAGLGCVFFGLYAGVILSGSFLLTPDRKKQFFQLMYNHPIEFVYLGLLIFICVSMSIYLVRLVIKHLFNNFK